MLRLVWKTCKLQFNFEEKFGTREEKSLAFNPSQLYQAQNRKTAFHKESFLPTSNPMPSRQRKERDSEESLPFTGIFLYFLFRKV